MITSRRSDERGGECPPGREVRVHALGAWQPGRPGRRGSARAASGRSQAESCGSSSKSRASACDGASARAPVCSSTASSSGVRVERDHLVAAAPPDRRHTRPVPAPRSSIGPSRGVRELAPQRTGRRRRSRSPTSCQATDARAGHSDHRFARPRSASRSRSSSSAV